MSEATPDRAGPEAPRRSIWRHWLVIGGAAAILGAILLFMSALAERDLRYLAEPPLRARIERAASQTLPTGYCDIEVWRLSEASVAALKAEGAARLVSPHPFQLGWAEGRWRALSPDLADAMPWRGDACRGDVRRDLSAVIQTEPGFAVALGRPDGLEEAVFVIGLTSGVFIRAVFTAAQGETIGAARPLAPPKADASG
ncbi:MAG: hypothetical protein AAGM38_07625 [Pseudomonadota bacterium]